MSQENVELVRRLQPRPDADLVAVFHDEVTAAGFDRLFAAFFHPDCECVLHLPGAEPAVYVGLEGWRRGWGDWLAPWVSYRSEIEELLTSASASSCWSATTHGASRALQRSVRSPRRSGPFATERSLARSSTRTAQRPSKPSVWSGRRRL